MKFSLQVLSKTQAQFWIRVFKLEEQIAYALKQIQLPGPRAQATLPIIAEFVVDKQLKFIYILICFIDALGLKDARGYVYGADPEGEKDCYERRDKLAEEVMDQIQKSSRIDEVIEMPEGKEEDESGPSKPSDRPQH